LRNIKRHEQKTFAADFKKYKKTREENSKAFTESLLCASLRRLAFVSIIAIVDQHV